MAKNEFWHEWNFCWFVWLLLVYSNGERMVKQTRPGLVHHEFWKICQVCFWESGSQGFSTVGWLLARLQVWFYCCCCSWTENVFGHFVLGQKIANSKAWQDASEVIFDEWGLLGVGCFKNEKVCCCLQVAEKSCRICAKPALVCCVFFDRKIAQWGQGQSMVFCCSLWWLVATAPVLGRKWWRVWSSQP